MSKKNGLFIVYEGVEVFVFCQTYLLTRPEQTTPIFFHPTKLRLLCSTSTKISVYLHPFSLSYFFTSKKDFLMIY